MFGTNLTSCGSSFSLGRKGTTFFLQINGKIQTDEKSLCYKQLPKVQRLISRSIANVFVVMQILVRIRKISCDLSEQ